MSRQPEDIFETSSFASLIQSEEREEIIPLDLHTASLIGDEDIVQDYIKRKANLNGLNHSGWTALMYAAYVGRYNILNLLVQANADINISSNKGLTALMLASYCASEQITQLLLQHGANVNACDNSGMTSLFHAVRLGHQSAVNLLATYHADLNICRTDTGLTPIMEAAIAGHDAIFNTLLEYGADVNCRTKKGENLRSLAVRYGNQMIVTLLEKHWQPLMRTPREEPTLPGSQTGPHVTNNTSKVSLTDGPAAILKIQNNMKPSREETPIAAVVPMFNRRGPYAPSPNVMADNNDVNMSDGTNSDMVATDMNSFDKERYTKKTIRFATEPPKQIFSSQHLHESQPLPKTLKELLEEYQIGEFFPRFEQQGIDIAGFMELSDNDLKDMGYKFGPRKRISNVIESCRERSKVHGNPVVDYAQAEKMQTKILNAKLHEAFTYIKELQRTQQQYRADVNSYMEAEQRRVSQLVYDMEDIGKNCKEAMGQMRKIKDFSNHTNTILQKVRDHPNCALISTELGIDNMYIDLANSVKGNMDVACNRLELSFRQVERTLGMVRNGMTQPNQGYQQ